MVNAQRARFEALLEDHIDYVSTHGSVFFFSVNALFSSALKRTATERCTSYVSHIVQVTTCLTAAQDIGIKAVPDELLTIKLKLHDL